MESTAAEFPMDDINEGIVIHGEEERIERDLEVKPARRADEPEVNDIDKAGIVLPHEIDSVQEAIHSGNHRDLDDVHPDEFLEKVKPHDPDGGVDYTDPAFAAPISTQLDEEFVYTKDGDHDRPLGVDPLSQPAIDERGWDHDTRSFSQHLKDFIDGEPDGK